MPFPMKIQPIDPTIAIKPAPKSRLKRLFEKQFAGVLRSTSSEKLAAVSDVEIGTICLDKMVINFIEENGDNIKGKCSKTRCNCFHGNCDDNSDDESDLISGDQPAFSTTEAIDLLKGMVVCASMSERNLLADVATIVDKHKTCKRKDELRKIVADGLKSIGHDASICKSRWEKTPSFPAGEYEYIDVVHDGSERILVDVDFRSEFETARSTKKYRVVLQSLPSIFVGKADRLQQIVTIASEAARQSLKKKGLSFPPWRKPEYMRNKWLSNNYERVKDDFDSLKNEPIRTDENENEKSVSTVVIGWEPPPIKPKAANSRPKVVTGLAFILREGLI